MVINKVIKLSVIVILAVFFLAGSVHGKAEYSPKDLKTKNEAVSKKVLDNGLVLLYKRSEPLGLVAIDINIKAGSALEGEYLGSGISHLVEHMVFKGTTSRKVGDVEREIKSYGGLINGSVSQDITNYHVVLPSKYLMNALLLLKDILENATFEPAEIEKEREVILKEVNLTKDDPERLIVKLLSENAYLEHPYRYPPIGYEKPLKALKRDDLVKYYRRMYVPNRMVICITGGIDDKVSADIEREFGNFNKPNYSIQNTVVNEPSQAGKREAQEWSEINLSYLTMGFHSVDILSKDLFALDVLSMILGMGDNSRLNKALFKEKKIVHNISAWNYTPRDPGLFIVNAILDQENMRPVIESVLLEIEKLKTGNMDDSELDTAKSMVIRDYVFSRETLQGQAADMCRNQILTGNPLFSEVYIDGVKKVTISDIKRVAEKYLSVDNLTIVKLLPLSSKEDKTTVPIDTQQKEGVIKKEVLPNGLTVLIREDYKSPIISICAAVSAGLSAEDAANNGIANMTSRMLLKGTSKRKEDEIRGFMEKNGGEIAPFSGFDNSGLSVTVLNDNFDQALEVLKDTLSDPVFPDSELAREKMLAIAMIKDENDDIFSTGANTFRKEMFKGSPYSMKIIGEMTSVSGLKREDLIKFYRDRYKAGNMVISVSGAVDAENAMKKIDKLFGDMKSGSLPESKNVVPIQGGGVSKTIEMEREESLLIMSFRTTTNKDPDKYALEVLGSIMSGHSGRLFHELRDKLSLAYTLGCVQRQLNNGGYLAFYVTTTADKIDESRKAILSQIRTIRSKATSGAELEIAKRELEVTHEINMQTNDFFAFTSAIDELNGLGCDNVYKYNREIEKVTADDITRVAVKYLDTASCVEIVIKPK